MVAKHERSDRIVRKMDYRSTRIRYDNQIPKRDSQRQRRLLITNARSPRRGRPMNHNLYYDLVVWLNRREMRDDINEWNKNILITQGRQYETQGSVLYRKKSGAIIPVVRQGSTSSIINLA